MKFYDYLVCTMENLDEFGKECIDKGYYDYLDYIGPLLKKILIDIEERDEVEDYD